MTQNNHSRTMTPDITKVATFNLCNYLEPPYAFYDFENIYSSEQWQKKQDWICRYLAEHQPDVIGFQEVFSTESLRQLVAGQGYAYFAVIDEPTLVDDYIFQDPVVAIASRFPILSAEAIQANPERAQAMGLSENFQFSRQPLLATIDLPNFGPCDCYVVHFKSKRPTLLKGSEGAECIIQALANEISGTWTSSIQRGSEAALLFTSIIERRIKSGNPILLMGDFNDTLQNGVLQHMQIQSVRGRNQPENNQQLAPYRLKDSWDLFLSAKQSQEKEELSHYKRPYSHYYGSKGSVLDYILLSCEFDTEYQGSLAEVQDYHTDDKHLINPVYERDSQSTDHAIIKISLKVRS